VHPVRAVILRCCALLAVLGSAGAGAQAPPVTQFAEHARLAPESLLIALAAAGERLIAVGDRGVIVLSDDRGRSWRQAAQVPTQALLTGVCFSDASHGVAVGHDEVILTSADAGENWTRTHYAPDAQRPLLDVYCGAAGQVIAVGAYSSYLTSADGGTHWLERKFEPQLRPQPAAQDAQPAANDYHLNRIVGDGARLYIAAEAGHLYRSDDGGGSWRELPSPYAGSFFGVLPLPGDALLAFGLRGNLFRSEDAGASWSKLPTGTVAMLDGATRTATGAVVVGLSGVVLVSRDAGRSFTLAQQADHSGLSAVLPVAAATLVVVGESGARLVSLPPQDLR
jgi:photosystem II stability/assembly factor-like uncharacterized protein